jgi:hypothetical protein
MESVAIHLQIEVIDLQCNTDLKTTSSPDWCITLEW